MTFVSDGSFAVCNSIVEFDASAGQCFKKAEHWILWGIVACLWINFVINNFYTKLQIIFTQIDGSQTEFEILHFDLYWEYEANNRVDTIVMKTFSTFCSPMIILCPGWECYMWIMTFCPMCVLHTHLLWLMVAWSH